MGKTNQILEVEYGTFACRLEGFDEPVETMKTVVAYFHELAGHDRFMDIAPQAPDLETLEQIVQDQDNPDVTAAYTDGKVDLRATLAANVAATEAADIGDHPAVQPYPYSVMSGANLEETIGAYDEDDAIAEVADAPVQTDTPFEEDLIAEDHSLIPADEPIPFEDSVLQAEEATEESAEDVVETVAEATEDWSSEDDGDAFAEETTDRFEEETAEASVDEAADIATEETAEAFIDDSAGDDIADAASEVSVAELDEGDLHETAAEAWDDTEVAAAYVAESDDDAVASETQTLETAEGAEDDAPVAEVEETADAPFYDPTAEVAAPAPAGDDSVAAKLQRIRALVGRAPPRNRDAANSAGPVSAGSIVERLTSLTGGAAAPATAQPDDAETDRLVDDFDFKNEDPAPLILSQTEDATAESDQQTQTDTTEVETPAEVDAEEEPRARRRQNRTRILDLPEADDAMSHILSRADEKLSEPESQRHRDAFAQLKAAVAATEAARQLGDAEEATDPQDAFREDYADAVHADEKAEDDDAAPLKLVASQEEGATALTTDRLREIAAFKDSPDTMQSGFAEFAEDQGATELSDLLEAAAAYIAFVEGDEDFSRPQVMKKVQMASSDEFSREDGLRSFGRLLRQSRIIKLNNGRFQVSDDTRFRPADRAAEG